MDQIVAAYATIGQGAGPLIVTQRAGLFEKYDLRVETPILGGSGSVIKALLAGEAQFGNFAAPTLVRSVVEEGTDLVFLTTGINQQFLVGHPGIKEKKDLHGQAIGIPGNGALNDVLSKVLVAELKKEGIGARLEAMAPGERDRLAFLTGKAYAGTIMSPPTALEARRAGCNLVVDFAEYGLNFTLGGIAARRSYVEANEDITRRFLTAYVEGLHTYHTDREFTVSVQAEYSGLTDRTLAEETYDITEPGVPRAPHPITTGLSILLASMAEDIPAAAGFDVNRLVEPRFINDLEDGGFITSLYQ